MPSVANKAILLSVQAYLASNNVRRSVLTADVNIPSASGAVNQVDTTVLPGGGTFSYVSISSSSGTVIRTTSPVTAQLTTATGVLTFLINSLFVFTDAFTSLVLVNEDPSALAQVNILQC